MPGERNIEAAVRFRARRQNQNVMPTEIMLRLPESLTPFTSYLLRLKSQAASSETSLASLNPMPRPPARP